MISGWSPPGRRSTADASAEASRRVSGTPSQAYDERPAVARGTYFDPDAPEPAAAAAGAPSPSARASGPARSSTGSGRDRAAAEAAPSAEDDDAGAPLAGGICV